jgi:hypothetical protein
LSNPEGSKTTQLSKQTSTSHDLKKKLYKELYITIVIIKILLIYKFRGFSNIFKEIIKFIILFYSLAKSIFFK